jgi:hypothetical protein
MTNWKMASFVSNRKTKHLGWKMASVFTNKKSFFAHFS